MINKVVKLDRKDLFEFNKSHFMRNKKRRILRQILITLMILCFFSGLILFTLTSIDTLLYISVLSFMLLLFHDLIPYTYKLILHYVYKKEIFLQKRLNYYISQEGIQIKSGSTIKVLPWYSIHHICINKNYFIFYISMQKASIIPRRYLNDEETKHLLDYIKAYIPKDKIDVC